MDGGLFSLRDDQSTRLIFRLLADGGDTAAPGNTSMRAMAGCSFTVPANTLKVGDLLRIYAAFGKGVGGVGTGADGIQVALHAGANGTTADPAVASFGFNLAAANRTGGGWTEWRIISATTMRQQGSGAGFTSMSSQSPNARPAIDTIPSVTSGFKLTLAAQMTAAGTADYCVVHDFRVYVER